MEIRGLTNDVNANRVDQSSKHRPKEPKTEVRGIDSEVSSHSRAPELIEYAEILETFPEIRTEVVEAVALRLAAGEFGTRDAAERTAQAMLGIK